MIFGSVSGRLGSEPDVRDAGNSQVLTFTVASKSRQKVDGEWQDVATWVRVQHFGKVDKLAGLLSKGSAVVVYGEVYERTYTKDGEKRKSLECNAQRIELQAGGSRGDHDGGDGGHSDRGNGGGNGRSGGSRRSGGGKSRDDSGGDDYNGPRQGGSAAKPADAGFGTQAEIVGGIDEDLPF